MRSYEVAVYDYQENKIVGLAQSGSIAKGQAYNIKLKRNTGGYEELSLDLPARILNFEGSYIDNFRINLIKNELLIQLTRDYGNEERKSLFVIRNIEKADSGEGTFFHIQAVDFAFDKLSKSGFGIYLDEEVGTAETLLTKVLYNSEWEIDEIDSFLEDDGQEKVRTLSAERSNRYSLIQEISELFEGFVSFDAFDKTVSLYNSIGEDRGIKFRYDKNLQNVTQNLESSEVITKLWVEGGVHPENGVTRIGEHTPSGENYLLNMDYYIGLGLLTSSQENIISGVNAVLLNANEKIGNLERALFPLIAEESAKKGEIESKTMDRHTKIQLRDEARADLKIEKNSAKIADLNAAIRQLTSDINRLKQEIDTAQTELTQVENSIHSILAEKEVETQNKETILSGIELSVGDFVKEGIYHNDNYFDSEALYKDALKIMERMSFPRVSYEANVVDLTSLNEFKDEYFDLGDTIYITNKELGLFDVQGRVVEIEETLDKPEETKVLFGNYDTKAEDLLKKIITATTVINSRKEIYDRAQAINADGTLNYNLLQDTFNSNLFQVRYGTNNSVIQDGSGLTIKDLYDENKFVRINAGGIFITADGGETFREAMSAEGFSALNIVSGLIDTKQVQVWNSDQPRFFWDDSGLYAYASDWTGETDFNKYIKFYENGILFTTNGDDRYPIAKWDWEGIVFGREPDRQIIIDLEGNMTVPKLQSNEIADGIIQVQHFDELVAIEAFIGDLEVASLTGGSIDVGKALLEYALIEDAQIDSANIKDAAIDNVHIGDAAIDFAKIDEAAIIQAMIRDLESENITTEKLQVGEALINKVLIDDAQIDSANIKDAAIDLAKIDTAVIIEGLIQDLTSDTITTQKIDIGQALIDYALIDDAQLKSANIGEAIIDITHIMDATILEGFIQDLQSDTVETNKVSAGQALLDFALIDSAAIKLANIDEAVITEGFVRDLIAERVTADEMTIGKALLEYAFIADTKIQVANIDEVTILDGFIRDLLAEEIEGRKLMAGKALVEHALIDYAQISTANIADLSVTGIKIYQGDAEELKIQSASIGEAQIQEVHIGKGAVGSLAIGEEVVLSSHISEGVIVDAHIFNLDAGKIDTGLLNTARVSIVGEEGLFQIMNNTLQVFEKREIEGDPLNIALYERVVLGDIYQDGVAYGLLVRGEDGETILFDHQGLSKEGFTDGYEKLVDGSLDPKKIDIQKMSSALNEDGKLIIQASQVMLTEEELSSVLSSLEENVSLNTSQISQTAEDLTVKISGISNSLETLESGLSDEIYRHIASAEITMSADTFKSHLQSTELFINVSGRLGALEEDFETAQSELFDEEGKSRIEKLNSDITQTLNNIEFKVEQESFNEFLGLYEQKIGELDIAIGEINMQVRDGGGSNLLKNSSGHGGFLAWERDGTDLESSQSNWVGLGVAKSGWLLSKGSFSQRVSVISNQSYSVSGRIRKPALTGTIVVTIQKTGGEILHTIFTGANGATYDQSFSYQFTNDTETSVTLHIAVTNTSTNSPIEITDLMFISGVYEGGWSPAAGELYNLNVQVDTRGLKVFRMDDKDNLQLGDYTIMSPQEFAGYYNHERVFTVNKDITEVRGLAVEGEGLYIQPVKFIQRLDSTPSLDVVWMGVN